MITDDYVISLSGNEEDGYVAEIRALKGCLAQGETIEECLAELETVATLWIETAKERGIWPSPN